MSRLWLSLASQSCLHWVIAMPRSMQPMLCRPVLVSPACGKPRTLRYVVGIATRCVLVAQKQEVAVPAAVNAVVARQ